MGGRGSGRQWHVGAKATTWDYQAFDIRRLHRERLLVAGNRFAWAWYMREEKVATIGISVKTDQIVLDYKSRQRGESEWHSHHYAILLAWTDCHLGGQRPWFRCPVLGCGRRVAILYGGDIYACRHCRNLVYESQRERPYDRLARRADRIREKLGWEPGILNGSNWGKPKGMHLKTFLRLVDEHHRLVHGSLWALASEVGLPDHLIENWL